MRVGYIGLGSQGGPIARRIAESGFETVLWARRAEALDPYRDTPATVAATPSELAEGCDLVCLCVVNDDDVNEVARQVLPAMRPGATLAIQSTVHPETCIRLADEAGTRGVHVLDAPVSGGAPAVEAGRLLVMVGGEAGDLERCRPVFETYGNPVVHVGPLGAGQLAKLVNNVTFFAHLGIAADAYQLGEAFGIPRPALNTVLGSGSGSSFAVPLLEARDLAAMGALAGSLFRKDVDLVAAVATARSASAGSLVEIADAAVTRMGHP